MSDKTGIEWTDSTWNPIVGCSIHSPGCKHCYAMRQAHRLAGNPATPHYAGTTKMTKTGPVFTGKVAISPDTTLTAPLRWKQPRRIFVNSMGDLFHESIPDEWIDRVFAVMALCPQHTFQVLTKRAERMREYVTGANLPPSPRRYESATGKRDDRVWRAQFEISGAVGHELRDWPLPNVWLGVSTERQEEADERIPHLLRTPAAVRFISAEPLLGPIDLRMVRLPAGSGREWINALAPWYPQPEFRTKLDWVIVGGESGPHARRMDPDWPRSLRDQSASAGIAFFMKQMTKKAPIPSDLFIRQFPDAA